MSGLIRSITSCSHSVVNSRRTCSFSFIADLSGAAACVNPLQALVHMVRHLQKSFKTSSHPAVQLTALCEIIKVKQLNGNSKWNKNPGWGF